MSRARRALVHERPQLRPRVHPRGRRHPGAYVESIRVERARALLEATDLQVEEVATRCGFGTVETLRRAFARRVHVSPTDYRERFATAEVIPIRGHEMNIAIPIFDGITALDAVGPYEVLSRLPGARVRFLAASEGPKRTDNGMLALTADATFDDLRTPT